MVIFLEGLVRVRSFAQNLLELLEIRREKIMNGEDLNLGNIGSEMSRGLKCELEVSIL